MTGGVRKSEILAAGRVGLLGTTVLAALCVLSGCCGPAGWRPPPGAPPPDLNDPVYAPALRHGFEWCEGTPPAKPGEVWIARRPVNRRGSRLLGAFGIYHEWIWTREHEAGLSMRGARYGGRDYPTPPWRNLAYPLEIMDHRGEIHKRGVVVKRVGGVTDGEVAPYLPARRTGTWFPFTNCNLWVHDVIHRARRTQPR